MNRFNNEEVDTSVRSQYRSACVLLQKAGVPDALTDARLLLCETLQASLSEIYLHPDRLLTGAELALFQQCIEKRCSGQPVQYILEKAWFMGLELYVTPDVLIPRPDTELLVETVLAREKQIVSTSRNALDLCCGSGAIALSLWHEWPELSLTASDLSAKALAVACENALRLRVPTKAVAFRQGDLFDALDPDDRFDFIVSNPPYIAPDEMKALDPLVREHEPYLALYGGTDGLDFYRRIAAQAGAFLTCGGRLYLEIGETQAEAVKRLLADNGWEGLQVIPDLAGLDRVVCAHLKAGNGSVQEKGGEHHV